MNKKIRQIDITEALELTKKKEDVYVITNPIKPAIKNFKNMLVGNVLADPGECIFFIIEEA